MRSKEAFTLVELSVVLTIIALIVGGIMMGRNLQRSSQVRNVLGDVSTYAFAIQQFQQQYSAVPGDMRDAQRIWGNAEGGSVTTDCVSPTTTVSTGRATCNGNGDGVISNSGSELFRAWQQLWAAGLIAGSYTGITTSAARVSTPGVNVPAGPIVSTGYSFLDGGVIDANNTSTELYYGDYTNSVIFGAAVTGTLTIGPALTTKEAYELDKKADDGLPGMGRIHSSRAGSSSATPNCANGTNRLTATYRKSTVAGVCALIFLNTFQNKTNP